MKNIHYITLLLLLILSSNNSFAQKTDSKSFVRGIMLSTPSTDQVDLFIDFINNELAPRNVNYLILKVNYHLEYISRPEIREGKVISHNSVKRILETCRKNNIKLVPLVNCLGHQSWGAKESTIRALLKAYPEFEENPVAKIENPDFYCRSYCPLHPEVHNVLFDLLDETIDVFEAKEFHVGMDETFVLGEDGCERCKGKNKAELFAGEVNKLNGFLNSRGLKMWMWGDRFLDAESTGLGKWQAATNGTHPSIDMISKDVMICDWHYKTSTHTATYFAVKGFPVISCSYDVPNIALQQLNEMTIVKEETSEKIADRMSGVMHTFWGDTDEFMKSFEGKKVSEKTIEARDTFVKLSENW